MIQSVRTGRFISAAPLVGGVFLGTGALLIPALRWYAWLAILLDYGTLAFVLAVPQIVRSEWTTCSWNLLEEYVGQRGDTTARIRLFRHGHLIVHWAIKRPLGVTGMTGMGRVGTWERGAESLVLRLGDDRAVFERLRQGVAKGWRQTAGFRGDESDSELSLDAMEFVAKG